MKFCAMCRAGTFFVSGTDCRLSEFVGCQVFGFPGSHGSLPPKLTTPRNNSALNTIVTDDASSPQNLGVHFIFLALCSIKSRLRQRHRPAGLAHSFLFCSCVYFCFFALSTVFHSITSPDNSLLSLSVLPVLFFPDWSFQLHISFYKSLPQP